MMIILLEGRERQEAQATAWKSLNAMTDPGILFPRNSQEFFWKFYFPHPTQFKKES